MAALIPYIPSVLSIGTFLFGEYRTNRMLSAGIDAGKHVVHRSMDIVDNRSREVTHVFANHSDQFFREARQLGAEFSIAAMSIGLSYLSNMFSGGECYYSRVSLACISNTFFNSTAAIAGALFFSRVRGIMRGVPVMAANPVQVPIPVVAVHAPAVNGANLNQLAPAANIQALAPPPLITDLNQLRGLTYDDRLVERNRRNAEIRRLNGQN